MNFLLILQRVVVLVSLISSATSSTEEFCQIKRFESVFNIDKDIYFVVYDQNETTFWRYDSKMNEMIKDKPMKTIVTELKFDSICCQGIIMF